MVRSSRSISSRAVTIASPRSASGTSCADSSVTRRLVSGVRSWWEASALNARSRWSIRSRRSAVTPERVRHGVDLRHATLLLSHREVAVAERGGGLGQPGDGSRETARLPERDQPGDDDRGRRAEGHAEERAARPVRDQRQGRRGAHRPDHPFTTGHRLRDDEPAPDVAVAHLAAQRIAHDRVRVPGPGTRDPATVASVEADHLLRFLHQVDRGLALREVGGDLARGLGHAALEPDDLLLAVEVAQGEHQRHGEDRDPHDGDQHHPQQDAGPHGRSRTVMHPAGARSGSRPRAGS